MKTRFDGITPGEWFKDCESRLKTPISCGEKHIAMVAYFKTGITATDISGKEHEANAGAIASVPQFLALLKRLAEIPKIDSYPNERAARAAVDSFVAAVEVVQSDTRALLGVEEEKP